MKYLIILGDGMADEPIPRLDNKTPLEVAKKPTIDFLAKEGKLGRLITIPEKMPTGSAVANMGVLGYSPEEYFQGRGVLEAASMGINLSKTDLALRCNLICVENGIIKNHSAGHITSEEAREIVNTINKELGNEHFKLHPGVSYRHLMVVKEGSAEIQCTPPHDVPGMPFKDVLVKSKNKDADFTADLLNDLILKSQDILEHHPINIKRKAEGKDVGNSLWFWSPGHKPSMPTMTERFGISGAVISAVDLIKGLGVYAGLEVINVEGATGLYDTNYEGKADAAVKALKKYDFLYLHVEASDEAGHEGDVELKIKTIEYLDERLTKRILDSKDEIGDDLAIAVLPDHPTPCAIRTHTRQPVPFLIYNPKTKGDDVSQYDEKSAEDGELGLLKNDEFIKLFLSK